MKLFFDTNILIDHALMRLTGQPIEISYIMYWANKHGIEIFISPCCIYTITFVLHKNGIRGNGTRQILEKYLQMLNLCNTNKNLFLKGLRSSFKDLEDSFQYMHGVGSQCDYLLTSNLSDFKPYAGSEIKVLSPAQFVNDVLNKKPGIDF